LNHANKSEQLLSNLGDNVKKTLESDLQLINDYHGKEEVFYVINAAQEEGEKPSLYLGLDREAVEDFAGLSLEDWEENRKAPKQLAGVIRKNSPLRTLNGLCKAALKNKDGYTEWQAQWEATQWKELEGAYQTQFDEFIENHLPFILDLRGEHTTRRTLDGIVLILALRALQESIRKFKEIIGERRNTGENVEEAETFITKIIDELFQSKKSPLLNFFHRMSKLNAGSLIHVPSGVIHAAGPGIFLAEVSHLSDNTFRIFDHGREFDELPRRDTHYTLAALSLSDESFIDNAAEADYIRPKWQDELVGDIRLNFIDSEYLKDWRELSLNVGDQGPTGQIVMCTKGMITLRTAYHKANEPKLWTSIEVPMGYTAYIPPPYIIFKITEQSLENLKQEGVPDDVLKKLQSLKYKEFIGEEKFLDTLKGTIGNEQTVEFKSLILKHADKNRQKRTIEVKTVDYNESACLYLSAKTIPNPPTLCITVGGTHFQFIYNSDSAPKREERHFWHEALPNPWEENDWDVRLKVLRDKLGKFLRRHHEGGRIKFLSLSWPGFIDNGRLYSNVLRCKEMEVMALVEGLENDRFQFDKIDQDHIFFDVIADIQVEVIDWSGHLRENRSGLLINFGSGICLAVYDAKARRVKEEFEVNGENVNITHLGRLMWFVPPPAKDYSKWEWRFNDKWDEQKVIETIKEGDYREEIPEGIPHGSIRLSEFLSTTAIVFRFILAIRQKYPESWLEVCLPEDIQTEAKDKLRTCIKEATRFPPDEPAEIAERWSEMIRTYRLLLNAIARPLFTFIAQPVDSMQHICQEFIEEIAYDYAAMIATLFESVDSLVDYADCLILGGYGGANFGGDKFLTVLKQALEQHRESVPSLSRIGEITQSRASQSEYRLLRVCRLLQ
jgi:hypothetical protein